MRMPAGTHQRSGGKYMIVLRIVRGTLVLVGTAAYLGPLTLFQSPAISSLDELAVGGAIQLLSGTEQLKECPVYPGAASQPGDGSTLNRSHLDRARVVTVSCVGGAGIILRHYPGRWQEVSKQESPILQKLSSLYTVRFLQLPSRWRPANVDILLHGQEHGRLLCDAMLHSCVSVVDN